MTDLITVVLTPPSIISATNSHHPGQVADDCRQLPANVLLNVRGMEQGMKKGSRASLFSYEAMPRLTLPHILSPHAPESGFSGTMMARTWAPGIRPLRV